jgi:type III restriction enzyme
MHEVLDEFREREKALIETKRKAVMTVDGKTVVADFKGMTKSFDEFWEAADMAVIDDAYRRAARIFSPDISRTYVDALAYRAADPDDADEFEEALVEGRVAVAALGLVTEVQAHFDAAADRLAKEWLATYNMAIKGLSHDRQESYRQIREMSAEPQDVDLVKPEARFEPTKVRENTFETALPTYKNHLLCDARGDYPADLNAWEVEVVETELKRDGARFWYRNPQQPRQSSLGIAYLAGEQYAILRPDFIFFAEEADGTVVADIVDPHGLHLADALPKLQGLALYAEAHAKDYRRIESVAEAASKLRVLDLTKHEVRTAIADAKDATSLFNGKLTKDY